MSDNQLYSNCCYAPPLGETCTDEEGITSGRCSRCKDGAIFLSAKQVRETEDPYLSSDFGDEDFEYKP